MGIVYAANINLMVACLRASTVPDSIVGWANVGPTSGQQFRRWANFGPTYIAVWGSFPFVAKSLFQLMPTHPELDRGNICHANLSNYRKTSNISRTLVGNKIVDNSDVVGASPVGAAPTTSSFST